MRQTSKKQREANRRNARKSTGPRTAEGKNRSRENALTHGLTATTCIYKPIRYENPADFAEIRARLFVDCKPVGTQEELAVEMMAAAFQRVKRAEAWETAYLDGGMKAIQHRHGKPLDPTSNDEFGCGIVLGADEHKLTWEHLDRLRRCAWADYHRAQHQLRDLQKERLERPVKEWRAFIARQNYLERTHVPTMRANKEQQTEENSATSEQMASFCPRCESALHALTTQPTMEPSAPTFGPGALAHPKEDLPKAA